MKGEKNMDEHPNIVMSGYYGFQNAGDDAVCYAIIEALRQEMPACDITVLSNDPELTEKTYGVSACDRWKLKEVWRALRRTDLLASGGGSCCRMSRAKTAVSIISASSSWRCSCASLSSSTARGWGHCRISATAGSHAGPSTVPAPSMCAMTNPTSFCARSV